VDFHVTLNTRQAGIAVHKAKSNSNCNMFVAIISLNGQKFALNFNFFLNFLF